MARKKTPKSRSQAQFVAAQARRTSGAAGVMGDRRTKRQRTRSAQKATALRQETQ